MKTMLRDSEEVRRFWAETEEQLGETVILYDMARCITGCGESNRPLWGLTFITDRALYFRHFAKPHWLTAFPGRGSGYRELDEEIYFSIDRDRITDLVVEDAPSILQKVFVGSQPVLTIAYGMHPEPIQIVRLSIETKFQEFIDLLQPPES